MEARSTGPSTSSMHLKMVCPFSSPPLDEIGYSFPGYPYRIRLKAMRLPKAPGLLIPPKTAIPLGENILSNGLFFFSVIRFTLPFHFVTYLQDRTNVTEILSKLQFLT
jgi:hypothetical protein